MKHSEIKSSKWPLLHSFFVLAKSQTMIIRISSGQWSCITPLHKLLVVYACNEISKANKQNLYLQPLLNQWTQKCGSVQMLNKKHLFAADISPICRPTAKKKSLINHGQKRCQWVREMHYAGLSNSVPGELSPCWFLLQPQF